tara:strand:- start:580 stop:870 length:291 start_codon:yes stop_codon:yes gene_type:complete
MKERITSKKLEASVDALNLTVNSTRNIWSKDSDGNLISREGMFKLDTNVGGYQLTKIVNDGGGETDLSLRMTAGEMHKFLSGLFLGMKIQMERQVV